VPVHQPRQVAPGKRRLLPGQCFESQSGISDDPLAVPPRQSLMLCRPLGVLAAGLASRASRPNLVLRLQFDPLRRKRPVIDRYIVPQRQQPFVAQLRPPLPPRPQQAHVIPVALLLAEPVALDRAHRQHDMRVRFDLAVWIARPMHVEVGNHPARHELLAHEILRQSDSFGLRQLARQGELDLPCQHRVLAPLDRLHLVPQR
jgi:hypothetical protein